MEKKDICEHSYALGLNQGYKEGFLDRKEFDLPELSQEEQCYRRGFAHGWNAGKNNPEMNYNTIKEWRYSKKKTGAPGTPFENKEF